MTESSPNTVERTLQAEKKNGVYLLSVETEFEGYRVRSGIDYTYVASINVNGNYIGTSTGFETECDEYTIEDNTLNLWYSNTQQ